MPEIGKVVVITTDFDIEIHDLKWSFHHKRKLINADFLECVQTQFLYDFFSGVVSPGRHVAMFVDECGLLRNLPVNPVASYFYGVDIHGNFIHGDVILFELDEFGNDFPLTNADAVSALSTHVAIDLYC